jgi:hypothetical protein
VPALPVQHLTIFAAAANPEIHMCEGFGALGPAARGRVSFHPFSRRS